MTATHNPGADEFTPNRILNFLIRDAGDGADAAALGTQAHLLASYFQGLARGNRTVVLDRMAIDRARASLGLAPNPEASAAEKLRQAEQVRRNANWFSGEHAAAQSQLDRSGAWHRHASWHDGGNDGRGDGRSSNRYTDLARESNVSGSGGRGATANAQFYRTEFKGMGFSDSAVAAFAYAGLQRDGYQRLENEGFRRENIVQGAKDVKRLGIQGEDVVRAATHIRQSAPNAQEQIDELDNDKKEGLRLKEMESRAEELRRQGRTEEADALLRKMAQQNAEREKKHQEFRDKKIGEEFKDDNDRIRAKTNKAIGLGRTPEAKAAIDKALATQHDEHASAEEKKAALDQATAGLSARAAAQVRATAADNKKIVAKSAAKDAKADVKDAKADVKDAKADVKVAKREVAADELFGPQKPKQKLAAASNLKASPN